MPLGNISPLTNLLTHKNMLHFLCADSLIRKITRPLTDLMYRSTGSGVNFWQQCNPVWLLATNNNFDRHDSGAVEAVLVSVQLLRSSHMNHHSEVSFDGPAALYAVKTSFNHLWPASLKQNMNQGWSLQQKCAFYSLWDSVDMTGNKPVKK